MMRWPAHSASIVDSSSGARQPSCVGCQRLRAKTPVFLWGILTLGVAPAGCNDPQNMGINALGRPAVTDNIIQVVKAYGRSPWLRFKHQGQSGPDGFKVSGLFLIDGETRRGAFGAGTIIINLYRVMRDQQGDEVAVKAYEWEYDAQQAMPFRSMRRSILGWGYQPRLHWGDLDLAGEEIEVEILYRRLDGQIINSEPKRFKVPTTTNLRRPIRRIDPEVADRDTPEFETEADVTPAATPEGTALP